VKPYNSRIRTAGRRRLNTAAHTLWALGMWPDSWAGIGRVAVGMPRDLQLPWFDERGAEEAGRFLRNLGATE